MDTILDSLVLDKATDRTLYVDLAAQIEQQIRDGLPPGTRLPPQRQIARTLGINLTTVTRAFRILTEKGLVSTRAGRGTTVNVLPAAVVTMPVYSSAPLSGPILDLTVNRPASDAYQKALGDLLPVLSSDPRADCLADYQVPEGPQWLRSEIARWLVQNGVLETVAPERLIITNGAQHALYCVLRTLCRPGDLVLADTLTYQGIISLCHMLDLRLTGIAMDDGGMCPAALEAACQHGSPTAIFLMPTLHNPTAITLSAERRQALEKVAAHHDIPIIEDDVYRCLPDDPGVSLTSLNPERHFYVGGFSKCVAPGLRIGFVVAPSAAIGKISAVLRTESWCVNALSMLVAMRLLESGMLDNIILAQKAELRARQAIVTRTLTDCTITTDPNSTHVWLQLPAQWNTAAFVSEAHLRGVAVLGSDLFALTDRIEPAVRLNVSAPRSHEDLTRALELVRETLSSNIGETRRPGVF